MWLYVHNINCTKVYPITHRKLLSNWQSNASGSTIRIAKKIINTWHLYSQHLATRYKCLKTEVPKPSRGVNHAWFKISHAWLVSIIYGVVHKGRPQRGTSLVKCGQREQGKGPSRCLQASTFCYSSMFRGRPLWVMCMKFKLLFILYNLCHRI